MKAPPLTLRRAHARAGFTLIELLVVVTIIALLFALVVGGYSYADRFSKTSSTKTRMEAIKLGLENYKRDFGEFPEPANPGDTVTLANKSYDVSGAAMLYQALRGDGYDQIKLAVTPQGSAQSDGDMDEDETNVKFTDMPKEIWTLTDGKYYMVDGFGKPFQYTKAVAIDPTLPADAQTPVTINLATYDLWSYGADEENITARSIDSATDEALKQASLKWIKNW
jgi:prepilin-type N-terminal cleavage/methylation domain-containing protein